MQLDELSITRRGGNVGIGYAGSEFVADLGIGLPIEGRWPWSFDRSLRLLEEGSGTGRDRLGAYKYLSLAYDAPHVLGEGVPIIHQELRAYDGSHLLVETRVLEDISGTQLRDSYFETTFNSPVLLFPKDFNFLAYSWGLMGVEGSRDGGHFPEAVTGKGVADIPAKLRLAGYSPREDLTTTSDKPFAPLVLYDDEGRTLVVSPFNHFLISPLRIIQTPSGMGVARGLHGSVDHLPRGTISLTALVFGQGVVETMVRWGGWLLGAGGKTRDGFQDSPLLSGIGFWNCYGGYYTELFRQANEGVLQELASYFKKCGAPIGYFGLDLWYNYAQVGFAKSYSPDEKKYPRGLGSLHRETGLPYLLHMSAFESPNDYLDKHKFAVDESSAYPMDRSFYDELARDFKEWGAFGVWPDFLRTQLQNSSSLRSGIGHADRLFDNMCGAFSDQELGVMMCMPTIGHYLASTRHQNVIAVRTHTDYLNRQRSQVEALRETGQVRNSMPLQQSIRHNVLLSLLAHALGLWPSYDVFLTNPSHPEGYGDPNAELEALLRAVSGGVVAVGDKAGYLDMDVIGRLCFPDGRLSRPDHPPLPVVSSLPWDVLAFYTTTTLGSLTWIYLALFNVGEEAASYKLDITQLPGSPGRLVYDYFEGRVVQATVLEGGLEPARGRYYVLIPDTGQIRLLGFPGKYITVSGRQVTGVEYDDGGLRADLWLPPAIGGYPEVGSYTLAVHPSRGVEVAADGAEIVGSHAREDVLYVEFEVRRERPSLTFREAPG